jgi:hypothetical protein
MKDIPDFVKYKFFEFLHGRTSIADFEQWVYVTDDLEQVLDGESYFSLISWDFLRKDSRYEIKKILRPHIDFAEYEEWNLKQLLTSFINNKGNPIEMLWEFYDIYCDGGFEFLYTLGLGYGLTARVPPNEYSSDYWEELTSDEQHKLMNYSFSGAIDEARKVLVWLEEKKIVIVNDQYHSEKCLFIDRRSVAEKEVIWHIDSNNP